MAEEHTKKLIVKNLPGSWTCDYLQDFLESVTPLTIAEGGIQVFRDLSDISLLTLEESLTVASFQEASQALTQMPFQSRTLTLEALTRPASSVLVHLADPSLTTDHVTLYFDNPRYSGCEEAEVESCCLYLEAGLAVVKFSLATAVQSVISRGPHAIKRGVRPMVVEPWYEQFHRPLLERLLPQREIRYSPDPLHHRRWQWSSRARRLLWTRRVLQR